LLNSSSYWNILCREIKFFPWQLFYSGFQYLVFCGHQLVANLITTFQIAFKCKVMWLVFSWENGSGNFSEPFCCSATQFLQIKRDKFRTSKESACALCTPNIWFHWTWEEREACTGQGTVALGKGTWGWGRWRGGTALLWLRTGMKVTYSYSTFSFSIFFVFVLCYWGLNSGPAVCSTTWATPTALFLL
jgi:hypothetical protein